MNVYVETAVNYGTQRLQCGRTGLTGKGIRGKVVGTPRTVAVRCNVVFLSNMYSFHCMHVNMGSSVHLCHTALSVREQGEMGERQDSRDD